LNFGGLAHFLLYSPIKLPTVCVCVSILLVSAAEEKKDWKRESAEAQRKAGKRDAYQPYGATAQRPGRCALVARFAHWRRTPARGNKSR
jgi:hypothetical protein